MLLLVVAWNLECLLWFMCRYEKFIFKNNATISEVDSVSLRVVRSPTCIRSSCRRLEILARDTVGRDAYPYTYVRTFFDFLCLLLDLSWFFRFFCFFSFFSFFCFSFFVAG